MTTSAKTGSNGHQKTANGKKNGSYRIFDDVLALAGTFARGRKDYGADKLHSLASSTRDFASSMTDVPNLKIQAASAVQNLESLGEYVMQTDIDHMLKDAETFARRHPIAALTMTLAAGLAVSRLFRSQPEQVRTASNRAGGARRKAVSNGRKRRAAPPRANGKARARA